MPLARCENAGSTPGIRHKHALRQKSFIATIGFTLLYRLKTSQHYFVLIVTTKMRFHAKQQPMKAIFRLIILYSDVCFYRESHNFSLCIIKYPLPFPKYGMLMFTSVPYTNGITGGKGHATHTN